jgi:hypothetical protein
MPRLKIVTPMIALFFLFCSASGTRGATLNPLDIGKPISVVPEYEREPVDTTPFNLKRRGNYYADWVISNRSGNIIGYAPWDNVKKRWTLFSMYSQYMGFIQATIGDFKHPEHYMQHLRYDRNNKYHDVFLTSLGGRPKTPERPFGELGGELTPYIIGNIPLGPMNMALYIDYAKLPMGIDISIRPRLR